MYVPAYISEISGAVPMDRCGRLGARLSGDPGRVACLSGPGEREILHTVVGPAAYHREQDPAAERFSCEACGFSLVCLPAGLYAATAGG